MANKKPQHRCPACKYDLTWLARAEVMICPECGRRTSPWESGLSRRQATPIGTLGYATLLFLVLPTVLMLAEFVLAIIVTLVSDPSNGALYLILTNVLLYTAIAIAISICTARAVKNRYRSIPTLRRSNWLLSAISLEAVLGVSLLLAAEFAAIASFEVVHWH